VRAKGHLKMTGSPGCRKRGAGMLLFLFPFASAFDRTNPRLGRGERRQSVEISAHWLLSDRLHEPLRMAFEAFHVVGALSGVVTRL
jgi:hypothetical protein